MFKIDYISSACNKMPHVVDWGRNNLICYAANNAIAIYDPLSGNIGAVLSTLHAHSGRVNAVQWIRFSSSSKPEVELISCSSDGSAIIWTMVDPKSVSFQPRYTLMHNKPIKICDAVYHPKSEMELVICTCTINGCAQIWSRNDHGSISRIQSLDYEAKLIVMARLSILPGSSQGNPNMLLVLAFEDSSLHLMSSECCQNSSSEPKVCSFTRKVTLHGHQNWIKCIDLMQPNPDNLLIATGSLDSTIRLWRITCLQENSYQSHFDAVGPAKKKFIANDQIYGVILESILNGHEAWVHGVHWHPQITKDDENHQPMKLLSCSLDKSVIIWEPDENTGLWSETLRVGSVGGNSLGLYGCKFSPNGDCILAHSYHGSFYKWRYDEKILKWETTLAPSGHHGYVVDLSWDPRGRFLLTTSADQTTRIHISRHVVEGKEMWHEIGRPQIHGYPMTSLAVLKPNTFASGAEEKVVRIFTAPLVFKNYLEVLQYDISDFSNLSIAQKASVPSLTLTNKAKAFPQNFEVERKSSIDCRDQADVEYDAFPSEDDLIRLTLWPEMQKLYGHGYEIFCMAARTDGKILATSAKASAPGDAVIILWNTTTWFQRQKLYSHQLTVTQLSFSPNDKYLLSVSRDRQWSLFICRDETYELSLSTSKTESFHTRIIWCSAWTIDSDLFATGSRDGKVGIWSVHDRKTSKKVLPVTNWQSIDMSITALAFTLDRCHNFSYIIAVGFENGCIHLKKFEQKMDARGFHWIDLLSLDTSHAHHATVRRLAFRPNRAGENKRRLQLASCSNDWSVKIFSFTIDFTP